MSANNHLKPYTFDRVIRLILSIAFVLAFFYILRRLSSVLIPFFIAVLIAYLMNPLVEFLQYKVKLKSRGLSVFISLILVFGIIYLLSTWLIPQFIQEMSRMIHLLRDYLQLDHVEDIIPTDLLNWIRKQLNNKEVLSHLNAENLAQTAKKLIGHAWNVFSGSVNIVISIISALIILVYLVFLLIDFKRISEGWIELVPPLYRKPVKEVFSDLTNGMNIYFRAQGLVALIVGILLAIGFKIIGLPMAIMIGLFIGALNIVPYLQVIGFIPVTLLALLKAMESHQNFWQVILAAAIVMAVVQAIQETILVPRIMGRVYGLHPAIILLSLSIWGSLLGLLGMLVALPLTTLLFSYYNRFVLQKEQIQLEEFLDGDKTDS